MQSTNEQKTRTKLDRAIVVKELLDRMEAIKIISDGLVATYSLMNDKFDVCWSCAQKNLVCDDVCVHCGQLLDESDWNKTLEEQNRNGS